MNAEQEAAIRECVARIVKGEAELIERMLLNRAAKWTNFILSEIAKDNGPENTND